MDTITRCRVCYRPLPEFEISRGVTICAKCDASPNPAAVALRAILDHWCNNDPLRFASDLATDAINALRQETAPVPTSAPAAMLANATAALLALLDCIQPDNDQAITFHISGDIQGALTLAHRALAGDPSTFDPPNAGYTCRACGKPITAAQADDNGGL